ncbi:BN159_2729 family protein [Streptomyces sp. NPDC059766]|uniref:BN159_2729 family protein n=1 Tax=Streptomyces sp. NPDC059766 TaxID=3346940 RepID=UPI0036573402
MNRNVPHAARVIRTVLATVRTEQASALAHALDSACLLVDPERSFGVVLYRTPEGGWSRTGRPVTELEQQALNWDAACRRAQQVAQDIERHLDDHPGPHAIRVEGDRVRVLLRVDGPAEWARWRTYFGITVVGERTDPHTLTGEGEYDGVRVTVVALGASTASQGATDGEEKRPFRIGETLYDLALPQRDAYGDIWYFQGRRRSDGMPLMSLDGRPERCSLANVVAYLGPLSPVRADDEGVTANPAPNPPGLPEVAVLPEPVALPKAPAQAAAPHTAVPRVLPNLPEPRVMADAQGAWAGSDRPAMSAVPDPETAAGAGAGARSSVTPGPWAAAELAQPAEPEVWSRAQESWKADVPRAGALPQASGTRSPEAGVWMAAVPRADVRPEAHGPWAALDLPAAGRWSDVPRPRVMTDLPDPRTVPDPHDARVHARADVRTVPNLPDPRTTSDRPAPHPHLAAQPEPQPEPPSAPQSEPSEPVRLPDRAQPSWAEPREPLVPSAPAAGPARPAR